MSNVKTNDYISTLNALRGIAALIVVFYHTQHMMQWTLTAMFKRGYLAVDLFFVLSGFVLMHVYHGKFQSVTKQSYWQFITTRFARIYPVHFAVLLFLVTLEPLRLLANILINLPLHEPIFGGQTTVYGIFTNVFLIQAWHTDKLLTWNGPSWSISSEWFAYLLAPFLIGAFAKLKTPTKAIGGLLIGEIGLLLLSILRPGGIDTTYDFGNLRMLFEFCMGLSVYNLYASYKASPLATKIQTDWPTVGLLALLIYCFSIGSPDFVIIQLYCLLIPFCALATSWLNTTLSSKPLFYLGEISYSLYMTHSIIVYTIMMKVMRYVHVEGILPSITILAIITLSSLMLAHVSYTYLEIPCRDYLRKKFKEGIFTPKQSENKAENHLAEEPFTPATYNPQPVGS